MQRRVSDLVNLLAVIAVLFYRCACFVKYGDEDCWGDVKILELCCYYAREEYYEHDGVLFQYQDRHDPCWAHGFNVSKCCNARVDRSAPMLLRNAFDGCGGTWKSFLLKFRVAAGSISELCQTRSMTFEEMGHHVLPWLKHWNNEKDEESPLYGIFRPRGCRLARNLFDFLAYILGWGAPRPRAKRAMYILERFEQVLQNFSAGAHVVVDSFFHAVGVTIAQMKHLLFLSSVFPVEEAHAPLSEDLREAEFPSHVADSMPLVFDFGMSGGVDTEHYLTSGLRVIAVEANSNFVQAARERLHSFLSNGRLSIIHAAVGGDSAANAVLLNMWNESSELLTGSAERASPTLQRVPLMSCGSVYSEFAGSRGAEYVKIDIEGEDLRCLRSLIHNSSVGALAWKASGRLLPPPPKYVSVELGLLKLEKGEDISLSRQLKLLLSDVYCDAKLCTQQIYNARCVKAESANNYGLGSSGPYGDAAVDWRSGERWRPLEEVVDALQLRLAATLARMARTEWFDLHLRRCLVVAGKARRRNQMVWNATSLSLAANPEQRARIQSLGAEFLR